MTSGHASSPIQLLDFALEPFNVAFQFVQDRHHVVERWFCRQHATAVTEKQETSSVQTHGVA